MLPETHDTSVCVTDSRTCVGVFLMNIMSRRLRPETPAGSPYKGGGGVNILTHIELRSTDDTSLRLLQK